jgi:DNA-binding MarR family transcriptional regulator
MESSAIFPTDSLVFLTNRVGRLLANEIRQQSNMEAWGLQHAHMGILVDLWKKEGVRQQDLAVSNIKDKGTIARALSSMEEENLVVRVPDANDKRIKLIYLTHRGRAMRERLLPYAKATVEEAVEGLSAEEIRTCHKVLKHILDKFQNVASTTGNSESKQTEP